MYKRVKPPPPPPPPPRIVKDSGDIEVICIIIIGIVAVMLII